MNTLYDVVIIGAGPAGLFAARELINKGVRNVLILEKGNCIEKRKKCETLYGVGGSGTFSDGKLHFSMNLSQEKLLEFCDRNEAQSLIEEVEQQFLTLGVKSPVTPTDKVAVKELIKECQKYNVRLYDRRCRHVGSDLLPMIMKKMVDGLLKNSIKIKTKTEVTKIYSQKKKFILETNKGNYYSKILLVTPGRGGTKWFQDQAKELKIHYDYQKVEVGVRVEFPASVTEDHSRIMYENIYSMQTPTFDDTMRTFCPCPNGYVAIEDYGDYICVNGHSNSNNDSPNSNFALVQEIKLTEPVENTTDYAISIAKLATTIGGGKPIIQRLMDLKKIGEVIAHELVKV